MAQRHLTVRSLCPISYNKITQKTHATILQRIEEVYSAIQEIPRSFRDIQYTQCDTEYILVCHTHPYPAEIPAGFAQSIVPQLRMDATETILAPHGAATVPDRHDGAILCVLQHGAQGIP